MPQVKRDSPINSSPFRFHVTNHAFITWTFFTPLWRTIKNSGRAGGKAIMNKNKNQNNVFCLPLIGFFTQSSQYQIWKTNTYSILINGNRTWTASIALILLNLKILWLFYDSEHKLHKTTIEKWLSIGFELNPPDWEPKVVTITLCSTYSVMESFELLHTHLQILETLHFP